MRTETAGRKLSFEVFPEHPASDTKQPDAMVVELMVSLETAWNRCFDNLDGSRPPAQVLEELVRRYREPHRAYHTLQHLQECFAWFDAARSQATRPGEVAFALFYHDAIYDTHASGNEERSARLAVKVFNEYVHGDCDPDRIADLILQTRHDAQPGNADARLLVDIDLAILGATPARFDEYERQVRAEYEWVPEEAFCAGRRRILMQFLDRPVLYGTPFLRDGLEAAARSNLRRSIAALAYAIP